MTGERLKEIRSLLDELPKGEWFEKEAAMPRGLTQDDRFDIYAMIDGKALQICHMHVANGSPQGMTLGWMKNNPKLLGTKKFLLESKRLVSELLDEIERLRGEKLNGDTNNQD